MSLSPAERTAISAAAQWYARLQSGIASDADRAGWSEWLQALNSELDNLMSGREKSAKVALETNPNPA